MDLEHPSSAQVDEPAVGDAGDGAGAASAARGTEGSQRPDVALEESLRARLERVVALASGARGRTLHAELLDELRALVREAETLPRAPGPTAKEVVERPARRLHGT